MEDEKMECYRQGDICFQRIDKIPEGWKKTGTILKIQGESATHAHLIEEVQVFNLLSQQALLPVLLKVPSKGAEMKHEEHSTLSLSKGIYQVTQFHEYQNPQPVD
jgi:hypothetical protein